MPRTACAHSVSTGAPVFLQSASSVFKRSRIIERSLNEKRFTCALKAFCCLKKIGGESFFIAISTASPCSMAARVR